MKMKIESILGIYAFILISFVLKYNESRFCPLCKHGNNVKMQKVSIITNKDEIRMDTIITFL